MAALLLGPAPASRTLASPVALPLDQQVAQLVRDSLYEHFGAATEHTGNVLEQLRITLGC